MIETDVDTEQIISDSIDVSGSFSFKATNKSFRDMLVPATTVATKGSIKDHKAEGLVSLNPTKQSIIVTAFGGKLALSLTLKDLDDQILDYSCSEEGVAVVRASHLTDAMNSFPDDEMLSFTFNGKEVKIHAAQDEEDFNSIPVVSSESIEIPKISNKAQKQLTIDRLSFLTGYNKVSWAVGFEDHREQYFYWNLIADGKEARFVAGTGGRFMIADFSGDLLFPSSVDATSFLFHKDQSDAIHQIFNSLKSKSDSQRDDIEIVQSERDGDAPEQIVMRCQSIELIIVGFDLDIQYPSMDKFLKPKKDNSIFTKCSNWEHATRGVLSAWTEDAKKEHESFECTLQPVVASSNKYLQLKTKTGLKVQRKIEVESSHLSDEYDDMTFKCNAALLCEVYTRNKKEDTIEVQFFNSETQPIIFSYSEKDNQALGISQKMYVLLAPYQKTD